MKLTLGPIPYFWTAERVDAFYQEVSTWPVDAVYLGETICAKRRALDLDDWLVVAERLRASGKEVVLSTLVLLEAESELGALERICHDGHYLVEANDTAAVRLLTGRSPFVVGPHVNAYNTEALRLMAGCGACRWVPPVELSRTTIETLLAEKPEGLEAEVIAFGRLPLAFSARCFTARAHNLAKDACEFRCADYPDGLPLATQEGQALFNINGIALQSAAPCNLIAQARKLDRLGVQALRIIPQASGTAAAVSAFRAVLDRQIEPAGAERTLSLPAAGWCNGYWHGGPGMDWFAGPGDGVETGI